MSNHCAEKRSQGQGSNLCFASENETQVDFYVDLSEGVVILPPLSPFLSPISFPSLFQLKDNFQLLQLISI